MVGWIDSYKLTQQKTALIRVSQETKNTLDEMRTNSKKSYDYIIKNLIFITKEKLDELRKLFPNSKPDSEVKEEISKDD